MNTIQLKIFHSIDQNIDNYQFLSENSENLAFRIFRMSARIQVLNTEIKMNSHQPFYLQVFINKPLEE